MPTSTSLAISAKPAARAQASFDERHGRAVTARSVLALIELEEPDDALRGLRDEDEQRSRVFEVGLRFSVVIRKRARPQCRPHS